jgi:hypothetical protein
MSEQDPWQAPGGPPPQGPPPQGQQPYGEPPFGQAPFGDPAYAQPAYAQPAYGAAPSAPGPAPQPVRVAAILLIVQIVLSVISSIVFLPSTYQRTLAQQPTQAGVDPQLIQSIVTVVLVVTIVVSVIWLGVWVFFVIKAWQGRNWARIVLTVFLAISLVSVLAIPVGLAQHTLSLGQLPFTVVTLALAVVALVLLWRQPAKGWYEAMSAYKRATGQYPR